MYAGGSLSAEQTALKEEIVRLYSNMTQQSVSVPSKTPSELENCPSETLRQLRRRNVHFIKKVLMEEKTLLNQIAALRQNLCLTCPPITGHLRDRGEQDEMECKERQIVRNQSVVAQLQDELKTVNKILKTRADHME